MDSEVFNLGIDELDLLLFPRISRKNRRFRFGFYWSREERISLASKTTNFSDLPLGDTVSGNRPKLSATYIVRLGFELLRGLYDTIFDIVDDTTRSGLGFDRSRCFLEELGVVVWGLVLNSFVGHFALPCLGCLVFQPVNRSL